MFDRMLGTAHRRAETSRGARLLGEAGALAEVARNHLTLGRALVAARRDGVTLPKAVEGSLGWDRLAASLEAAAGALGTDEGDGLDEPIGRHASLRKAAAILFDAFVFRSFKPHDPILAAIDMPRAIHHRERRKLPDRVPAVSLKRSWRKRVKAGSDGLDARAHEVAVLVHLRDRLRAGDAWVEGSRAYRTFDDHLLPRATFALMRAEQRLGLAVPDDFAAWRIERAATLDRELKALALAAAKDQLAARSRHRDRRPHHLADQARGARPRPGALLAALQLHAEGPHHGSSHRGECLDRLRGPLHPLPDGRGHPGRRGGPHGRHPGRCGQPQPRPGGRELAGPDHPPAQPRDPAPRPARDLHPARTA
jgi:hypothetical protein